ncbi:PREDICTED: kelch-like protein 10 [Merops nubicus]|uniref:kelch-like protein 10 n=1 Tax=Merops nubicus TaxID=57421 RepID=UPI0004F02AEC|nr:PREDICTED: kelch-like protein 10 [Merops nubicus]
MSPGTIYNELHLEGKLCDVVISVDSVEFNAHKMVCGCSPYFRVLFAGSWSEAGKRVYKIPGTSSEMMRLIIKYAYSGTVPLTTDSVENLITADQFIALGIVGLCCEFLKSHLSVKNCIGIWRLTDWYNCPDMREAASAFILQHFEEVTKVSAEFLELSVSELKHLIERDELNVRQEDAVFEAILQWIGHDPQNRRRYVTRGLNADID